MKKYLLEVSNIKFIIVFSVLLFTLNNALIIDKFTIWFSAKGVLDIVGLSGYMSSAMFLTIAFLALFAHRYIIKTTAIIIVICSASVTYFIAKYNVALDQSMIKNIFYTDRNESLTLITSGMIPYAIFLIIIPIFIIVKTKITFDRPLKHTYKIIALFVSTFLIALAIAYLNFNSIHKAGNQSNRYILLQIVPANYIGALIEMAKEHIIENYTIEKKPVVIEGKVLKDDDLVVVLAIGETSRQKNFNLYGYNRDTNPLLSKQEDLHILNGIAKYGSTLYAIGEILSRGDFKLPSITQTLGIDTSCYCNFQLYGNCGIVEEIFVSECGHGGKCYDEDVIPLLKENLKSYESGQRMVVLHIGGGSHGPIYQTRVPLEFQKFQPLCEDADVSNKCTIEELYNSFDNTIIYTDYVVSNIIDTLEESGAPYVMIYLSDHGESLLEEGRIFHGMPPGIALPPEQAQVPLIVKSSIPIKVREQEEYTQQDLYDTILDLFSIEIDLLRKDRVFIKKDED